MIASNETIHVLFDRLLEGMSEDVELPLADVIKQLLVIGWEQKATDTEELKSCLQELSNELDTPSILTQQTQKKNSRREKTETSGAAMAVAYLRLLGSLRPALENHKVSKRMSGRKPIAKSSLRFVYICV